MDVKIPLSEAQHVIRAIPTATPEEHEAAVRYLRRTGNTDLAPMLGLGGDAA